MCLLEGSFPVLLKEEKSSRVQEETFLLGRESRTKRGVTTRLSREYVFSWYESQDAIKVKGKRFTILSIFQLSNVSFPLLVVSTKIYFFF